MHAKYRSLLATVASVAIPVGIALVVVACVGAAQ